MPVTTAKSNIGAELKHLVQDSSSLNAIKNNPLTQVASEAAQIGLEAAQLEARQQSMSLLGTCLQELQNLTGGDHNPGQMPNNNGLASTPAPTSTTPQSTPAPSASQLTINPDPNRSVADTLDDKKNSLLKNLGDKGDEKKLKDLLKKKYGDWSNPNLPDSQRKAAITNANAYLRTCQQADKTNGSKTSDSTRNSDKLTGISGSHEIFHGTQAALAIDGLKSPGTDISRLTPPENKYKEKVNADGTLNSDAKAFFKKVGHGLLKAVSAVEHAMSNVASFVAALHIPVISQIAQAGEVTTEAVADGADVANTALEGGDTKKAAEHAGEDLGETAIGAAIDLPGAKQAAKGFVDAAKNAGKEAGKQGAEQVASQYSPIQV